MWTRRMPTCVVTSRSRTWQTSTRRWSLSLTVKLSVINTLSSPGSGTQMRTWTRSTGWVEFKVSGTFILKIIVENYPGKVLSVLPVFQEFQLRQLQLWRTEEDGLCLHEVEGALSRAGPHYKGDKWADKCQYGLNNYDLFYAGY